MPEVDTRLKHDSLVTQIAVKLLSQGWQVKARVEGWFPEPDVINGYRPDIWANRGNEYLLIEVKKGAIDHPKIVALSLYTQANPQYQLHVLNLDDPSDAVYALRNAG